MQFNLVDLFLLLIILASAWNGYRRGFILGALDLLGWALVVIAGLRFYQPLAKVLRGFSFWPEVWDRPIAFILIAVVVIVAFQALGLALLKRVQKDVHERDTNRLFGLIPGLANGLITAALLAALMLAMPISASISNRARESSLVNRLAIYAQRLEGALHPVFAEAVAETMNLLTVQPESHERVNLPYRVTNAPPRADLEARMLQLVNQERVAAGLRPLVSDPELIPVARAHSADMFARGYFAHATPEGRDPFDRIRAANVSFITAGENLALGPTVQVTHNGLMNSPGHRRNIMDPKFGRVGIGILDGGLRGLMVTQNFRN